MAKYRKQLPQLSGGFFLINGGLETTLIYHAHKELPCFASFNVLKDESGCQWMRNYLSKFADIAQKYNVGLILESATWRAHSDWLKKLGYSEEDGNNFNRKSIEILCEIREKYETEKCPMVLNASVGPRGDGYTPGIVMTAEEAQAYHAKQIGVLSQTKADMITAMTINYPDEAIGIVRAAKDVGIPVIVSFTLENDGKLPTGHTLKEAIELVDKATGNGPAYYMINCTHPSHFTHIFPSEEDWVGRIHAIKGNASKKSHGNLDGSEELDDGNPQEFGLDNQAFLYKLKNLNVFGGCCGTDYRHHEEICKACIPVFDQVKHHQTQPKASTKND